MCCANGLAARAKAERKASRAGLGGDSWEIEAGNGGGFRSDSNLGSSSPSVTLTGRMIAVLCSAPPPHTSGASATRASSNVEAKTPPKPKLQHILARDPSQASGATARRHLAQPPQ